MPTGFEPFRPFTSALAGAGAAQTLIDKNIDIETKRQGLEDYRGRQTALTAYADTGETRDLMKYDPNMVMKLDDQRAKRMGEGIDLVYKAAPFLLQQAGNPMIWNAFADQLDEFKVPKAVSDGFRSGLPEERLGRLKGVIYTANQLQEDLARRQSAIDVSARKQLMSYEYEKVKAPLARLTASLHEDAIRLAAQMKSKYDIKTAANIMPKELAKDVAIAQNTLTNNLMKIRGKLEEELSYIRPNPAKGYTQEMAEMDKQKARDEFQLAADQAWNETMDTFRPIAEQFKIAMPPRRTITPRAPLIGGTGMTKQQLMEAIQRKLNMIPK